MSAVLTTPMKSNDAEAETVRDYLVALVRRVWKDDEGFSGKRPFGNSSWKFEVYEALIEAGLVDGTLDDDGYVEALDEDAADSLILEAIDSL